MLFSEYEQLQLYKYEHARFIQVSNSRCVYKQHPSDVRVTCVCMLIYTLYWQISLHANAKVFDTQQNRNRL